MRAFCRVKIVTPILKQRVFIIRGYVESDPGNRGFPVFMCGTVEFVCNGAGEQGIPGFVPIIFETFAVRIYYQSGYLLNFACFVCRSDAYFSQRVVMRAIFARIRWLKSEAWPYVLFSPACREQPVLSLYV